MIVSEELYFSRTYPVYFFFFIILPPRSCCCRRFRNSDNDIKRSLRRYKYTEGLKKKNRIEEFRDARGYTELQNP